MRPKGQEPEAVKGRGAEPREGSSECKVFRVNAASAKALLERLDANSHAPVFEGVSGTGDDAAVDKHQETVAPMGCTTDEGGVASGDNVSARIGEKGVEGRSGTETGAGGLGKTFNAGAAPDDPPIPPPSVLSGSIATASYAEVFARIASQVDDEQALARLVEIASPIEMRLEALLATIDAAPRPSRDAVAATLHRLVRDAQQGFSGDRRGFVYGVNRLIDSYSLRLKLDDGRLMRLTVSEGSRRGTIQLQGQGPKSSFESDIVSVVPITFRGSYLEEQPKI